MVPAPADDDPQLPASHLEDDEDEEPLHCYRHPSEETALRCLSCERPICVDCAVHGAVGIKCPECAHVGRAARGVIPVQRLVAGGAAAGGLAGVGGYLLWEVPIPYFGLFIAYFVGAGIGTAARRAAGGFRDPHLTQVVTVITFVGVALWPTLHLLRGGSMQAVLFPLIAAAVAAYGGHQRSQN